MQFSITVYFHDISALENPKKNWKHTKKSTKVSPEWLFFRLWNSSEKTNKRTIEVKRLRCLALEIFKAFNEKYPTLIKDYFEKNGNSASKKYDLKIPIRNSVTCGDNGLRSLATRVWNSLPQQLKTETSYLKFKEEIYKSFGPKCKCSLYSYIKPI